MWTAGIIHSGHVSDTYTDCTGTVITDSNSENMDMWQVTLFLEGGGSALHPQNLNKFLQKSFLWKRHAKASCRQ